MNRLKINEPVLRGSAYFIDPNKHHLDRFIDWNNRFNSSHQDSIQENDIKEIFSFISTHLFHEALSEEVFLNLNSHCFIDFPYDIEVRLDEAHPNVLYDREECSSNPVFDRLFTTWHRPVIKPSTSKDPGIAFVLNLDHNATYAYQSSKNKNPRSFYSFYFHYYLDILHTSNGLTYCLNLGSITSIERLPPESVYDFILDKQKLIRFLESKGFIVREAPPYSIYPSPLPSPRIML